MLSTQTTLSVHTPGNPTQNPEPDGKESPSPSATSDEDEGHAASLPSGGDQRERLPTSPPMVEDDSENTTGSLPLESTQTDRSSASLPLENNQSDRSSASLPLESDEGEEFPASLPLMDDESTLGSIPLMDDESTLGSIPLKDDEDEGHPFSPPLEGDEAGRDVFTPAPFSSQLSAGDLHRARALLKKHVRRMSYSHQASGSRSPLHMTPAFTDLPKALLNHFFEKGHLTPLAIGALLKERNLLPDSFFEMKNTKGYDYPLLKTDLARVSPLPVAMGLNNEGIFLVQITEQGRQHLHDNADRMPVRSITPPPSGFFSALKRMTSKSHLAKQTSGPLAFVIKQTSHEKGIEELHQLALIQDKLFERLKGVNDPHLPRIALAEHCYNYTAPDHSQHMVFVLHGAKGIPLETHIRHLQDAGETEAIHRTLADVGRSIGALHYALAPDKTNPIFTLPHRDLNTANVMYSAGRTTLIDNGSIAISIEMEQAGHHAVNMLHHDLNTLLADLQAGGLHSHFLKTLLDGYLDGFPAEMRPLIVALLRKSSVREFVNVIE